MMLIGIILKINQMEPTNAPLIPASAGVEDEKLVKNSGVRSVSYTHLTLPTSDLV